MSDREISLRSIIFLVIGILLLLSLVICIYIVDGEKDLVKISADVIDVKKDTEGTGKNDVTVSYRVNNVFYEYNFYYKNDINVNDKIDIYYHENNVVAVQTFKTSKLIFICPIVGLLLCIFGLFELFKKSKDEQESDEFKTQVISVVGNTQQLKIITNENDESGYVKSEEELEEEPVRELASSRKVNPFLEADKKQETKESILPVEEEAPIFREDNIHIDDVSEETQDLDDFIDKSIVMPENDEENEIAGDVLQDKIEKSAKEVSTEVNSNKKIDIDSVLERVREENKIKQEEINKATLVREEKKNTNNKPTKKVQAVSDNAKVEKKVNYADLKKVLPKYYYVVKNCLVYEISGKEAQEINFRDVIKVKKTINSEGNLVKVCIMTNKINCVLTNMSNVDLNSISNTIHNKMLNIDDKFTEEIEYKEY